MSLAIIHTRIHVGIQAQPVSVEVHLANGLPAFSIVGLPEKAVQESRERVRAAITNSQFEFPNRRITVNLAPADLPKEGGGFDLPIAIGILVASGQVSTNNIDDYEFIGELALSGKVRPARGILPVAMGCQQAKKQLIFPADNQHEVSLLTNFTAYPCNHLLAVTAHLNKVSSLEVLKKSPPENLPTSHPDLSDIRGQPQAKRALLIAAAGRHSLLMVGPPGSGKSMLAHRLPGILPSMTDQQALETAVVYSISSQGFNPATWKIPPFRSPHHSASSAALVGGGSIPRPGEISLAHNGVLFLDELTEFDRRTLDYLREPMENGYIRLSRVAQKSEYPANFQLIAAMNPCPCGYLGDEKRACGTCTVEQVKRYQGKVSGPVMDRIDMHIEVAAIPADQLIHSDRHSIDSHSVRQLVSRTRETQLKRQEKCNSELNVKELEQIATLDKKGQMLIQQSIDKLGLSARAYHRILRLSRTIADLAEENDIKTQHVAEAISYRKLDRQSL